MTILIFSIFFRKDIDDIIANLSREDVNRIWQQFTANIDIAKTRRRNNDFDKALRNVVCAGLFALSYGDVKDAQSLFFNLNNDLYTVNLNIITNKGWNVANSMSLEYYRFNAPKGSVLIEVD